MYPEYPDNLWSAPLCHKQSVDTLVLVTHPFEFIKKADFRYNSLRPNKVVQRRLDKLCHFLSQHQDRFQIGTFGALAQQLPKTSEPPPSLRSSTMSSIFRATQNFINDRI